MANDEKWVKAEPTQLRLQKNLETLAYNFKNNSEDSDIQQLNVMLKTLQMSEFYPNHLNDSRLAEINIERLNKGLERLKAKSDDRAGMEAFIELRKKEIKAELDKEFAPEKSPRQNK